MTNQKLAKSLEKLFGYGKYHLKSFDFDEADDSFIKPLGVAWDYLKPKGLWSEIQVSNGIKRKFQENSGLKKLSRESSLKIVQELEEELRKGKREVFFIFPIVGSSISKSVFFENCAIINSGSIQLGKHELSTDEFIEEVSDNFTIDKDCWIQNIEYLKMSNSPGFLEHPTMIFKMDGYIYEISNYSRQRMSFALRLLNILGKASGSQRYYTIPKLFKSVNHNLTFNSDNLLVRNPIPDNLSCIYNLDFMLNNDNQRDFSESFKIYSSTNCSLKDQYFSSINFVNQAIVKSEYGNQAAAMKALFLTMSAETILNANFRGEIKSKIGRGLKGYLEEKEIEMPEIDKEFIEVYLDRSKYVHAGKANLDKYSLDMLTNKPNSESLDNSIIGICRVLLNFPSDYFEFNETKHNKKLDQWHSKIRAHSGIVKRNILMRYLNKIGHFIIKLTE